MKTTPDPVECVCGTDAYVADFQKPMPQGLDKTWYYVRCGSGGCWSGPKKPTIAKAVWHWDDLMLSGCV